MAARIDVARLAPNLRSRSELINKSASSSALPRKVYKSAASARSIFSTIASSTTSPIPKISRLAIHRRIFPVDFFSQFEFRHSMMTPSLPETLSLRPTSPPQNGQQTGCKIARRWAGRSVTRMIFGMMSLALTTQTESPMATSRRVISS